METFKIKDNYINVIIPFKQEVLANHGVISGAKSGVNDGINKNEQLLIEYLRLNPHLSAKELSLKTKIPCRNIQRYISNLKEKGIIRRVGSKKNGYWEII